MKTLLPVLLAACPLAGQTVSLTASAATPLTTRAMAAGTTDVQTLPGGPLPANGWIQAQASLLPGDFASMSLSWVTQLPGQSQRLLFGCSFLGIASGNASPASAGVDPFELLVHFQAPTPRQVLVTANVIAVVPPGCRRRSSRSTCSTMAHPSGARPRCRGRFRCWSARRR